MRLEQLYYLVEVNNTRSISLAAENLFITQPALSIAISNLEKELGVKLLERTKSGVYPTTQGQIAIELAQDILDKLDKLSSLNAAPAAAEQLSILTIPALNCGLLQQALINFNAVWPHIPVHIREEKPTIALTLYLREHAKSPAKHIGIVDIPIRLLTHQREWFHKNHLIIEPLVDDEMICLMSSDHPLAQKESLTLQDCCGQPLIKLEFNPDNYADFVKDPFSPIGSANAFYDFYEQNEALLTVSTVANLKRLVAQNVGLTIIPSAMIYNDLAYTDGKLLMRRFSQPPLTLHYHLIYSAQQPLSAIERSFFTTVHKVFTAAAGQMALSPSKFTP